MILADTFGLVFVAVAIVIVVVLAAAVGYWFLSNNTPRGTVFGAAILIYCVGIIIPVADSRLLLGISGVLKMCGFIGVVLGTIDLVRRRGEKLTAKETQISALKHSLGAPRRSSDEQNTRDHDSNQ